MQDPHCLYQVTESVQANAFQAEGVEDYFPVILGVFDRLVAHTDRADIVNSALMGHGAVLKEVGFSQYCVIGFVNLCHSGFAQPLHHGLLI